MIPNVMHPRMIKYFILFFSLCDILGGMHIFIRNTKFCQVSLTFCFDSVGVCSVDVATLLEDKTLVSRVNCWDDLFIMDGLYVVRSFGRAIEDHGFKLGR